MPHILRSKKRGDHSSLIPFAEEVANMILKRIPGTTISAGIIRNGKGGEKRVKISALTGGVRLAIRQSGTIQSITVFGHEKAEALSMSIAEVLKEELILVSLGE